LRPRLKKWRQKIEGMDQKLMEKWWEMDGAL
jgi:hypothetical protein